MPCYFYIKICTVNFLYILFWDFKQSEKKIKNTSVHIFCLLIILSSLLSRCSHFTRFWYVRLKRIFCGILLFTYFLPFSLSLLELAFPCSLQPWLVVPILFGRWALLLQSMPWFRQSLLGVWKADNSINELMPWIKQQNKFLTHRGYDSEAWKGMLRENKVQKLSIT